MKAMQTAAVARAESVWNTNQVHDVGNVPGTPVTPYNVVGVSGGGAENQRNDGTHGSKAHWIVVQSFGKSASEVGFAVEKADLAFQDHRLVVVGYDTTPATADLTATVIRDPDGGSLLMVTQTYSFHAYPTE